MKIKRIIRKSITCDFTAEYECEHCDYTVEASGYDGANFHNNVIPNKRCPECGKTASGGYEPMEPKYPAGMIL